MNDLVEFLLARVAEDEAVARKALQRPGPPITRHYQAWACWTDGGDVAALEPERMLAECEAKRRIVALRKAPRDLGTWQRDVGGDYTLGGPGYFANYWPDDTVSATVYADASEGADQVATSGIMAGAGFDDCCRKAERWIRRQLRDRDPVLRLLALPYADHPDYREEWKP